MTLTPTGFSTLRDRIQEKFNLTYDEAYSLAGAIAHSMTCEEYRLDVGRHGFNNLHIAVGIIIE